LQVRSFSAGDAVGYNGTYICDAPTRVATLSLGYADGYLRSFSGAGSIFVGDAELPVIGRVSMDLATVNISATPDIVEGDWVNISYDLQEASHRSGLSQYELLTGLGRRFDRIWM
jgi:alanine racemase